MISPSIKEAARKLGLVLTPQMVTNFIKYEELLQDRTRSVNLVSPGDAEKLIFHFLDSLSLLKCISPASGARVLDLGTGAGFPGLPLKIVRPDLLVTFMDSRQKKLDFIREVIQALSLKDTEYLWGRAEDLSHEPLWRARFHVVCARAVAPLAVLVELSLPFLFRGGLLAAYKGPKAGEEIDGALNALNRCGGRVINRFPIAIEGINRELILVEKWKDTPVNLPRKAGVPQKRPL